MVVVVVVVVVSKNTIYSQIVDEVSTLTMSCVCYDITKAYLASVTSRSFPPRNYYGG